MSTRTIFGRYELIAQLDDLSSQSEVWVGREKTHSTLVKVTKVPAQYARDKATLRAYHTPARRISSIERATIERVYEANVDHDGYFIVSEFVRGEMLSLLLERVGLLPVELTLAIMCELGSALHVLHSISTTKGPAPVFHQLLSPANVLLTYHGEVKLAQAASSLGEVTVLERIPLALLAYNSPEECMGARANASSNVFTLGIILWEMLTGERLYGMRDEFDIMQAICHTPPPAPSKINAKVPPFLDALVNKALAKDPARRISSVGQFTTVLQNVRKNVGPLVSERDIAALLFEHFEDRVPSWQELFEAEAQGDRARLARAVSSLFLGHVTPDVVAQDDLRRTEEILYDEDSLPIFDSPGDKPRVSTSLTSTAIGAPGRATRKPASPVAEQLRGTMLGSPNRIMSSPSVEPQVFHESETKPFIDTPAAVAEALSFDQLSSELEQSVPEQVDPPEVSLFGSTPVGEDEAPRAVQPRERPPIDRTAELPTSMTRTVKSRLDRQPEVVDHTSPELSYSEPVKTPAREPTTSYSHQETPSPGVASSPDPPTHASWYFGDDEAEPDVVFPFSTDDLFASPPTQQGVHAGRELLSEEPVAEIMRLIGGRVVETTTLKRGASQYKPQRSCVIAKLHKNRLEVTRSKGTSGEIHKKNAEGALALDREGGQLILQVGDSARIHDGVFDYHIKFFYPPLPPAKLPTEKRTRLLVGFAAAGGVALALHIVTALFLVFFVGVSGMQMTVPEPEAAAEVFAEGKLEDLDKPKPKPKPKPRPKPKPKPKPVQLTERRVDPTEQKAIVPKSVQKKIARRMNAKRSSSDESKADRLLGALTSPNQGEGTTLQEVVSNIDAVQGGPGASSGAFKIAGQIAAIEGNSPNLATGGGGKIGDLSGGVKDGVGKVDKRKVKGGGKVRGKVRSVKALSKVKGGSLSKGDVYKEINRHMGKIRMCYERELMDNNKLAGKITFDWTVKTNGRVKGVREKSSSLKSAKVSSCIKKVIKKMKFPKPKGGEVQISYPFIFSAG